MARTVDTEAHAVRREAFVDAALRLMQAKGYDQMSIQDVLDELDASRGAFYHYFDSKTALLEAVVTRIVDAALASVTPIVEDPALDAKAKLEGFFGGIAQWKTERTDENTLLRDKMWRHLMLRLAPQLAAILRQGADEGVFAVGSPDNTARVLVALLRGLNDLAVRTFVERDESGAPLAEVQAMLAAYIEAMERILGVPAGTLTLVDEGVLQEWYA
ncbi:MAG TPA: TetR/AcrR family transcriptional regulator [Thermoleophilia bacterium]